MKKTEIKKRIEKLREDLAKMQAEFMRTFEITLSWKMIAKRKELQRLCDDLATVEIVEALGYQSWDMQQKELLTK